MFSFVVQEREHEMAMREQERVRVALLYTLRVHDLIFPVSTFTAKGKFD